MSIDKTAMRGGYVDTMCPECHGTGFVLVAPTRSQEDFNPFKGCYSDLTTDSDEKFTTFSGRHRKPCAVCGGDGVIDPGDFGGPDTPTMDWYMDLKMRNK